MRLAQSRWSCLTRKRYRNESKVFNQASQKCAKNEFIHSNNVNIDLIANATISIQISSNDRPMIINERFYFDILYDRNMLKLRRKVCENEMIN